MAETSNKTQRLEFEVKLTLPHCCGSGRLRPDPVPNFIPDPICDYKNGLLVLKSIMNS
jgi:hypothetical protein